VRWWLLLRLEPSAKATTNTAATTPALSTTKGDSAIEELVEEDVVEAVDVVELVEVVDEVVVELVEEVETNEVVVVVRVLMVRSCAAPVELVEDSTEDESVAVTL
jgi:hypothetical protein